VNSEKYEYKCENYLMKRGKREIKVGEMSNAEKLMVEIVRT
jgi:hypothetical protein